MNKYLIEWISGFDSYKDAADSIGMSVNSVASWCSGRRKLSRLSAAKISHQTDGTIALEELAPHLFTQLKKEKL